LADDQVRTEGLGGVEHVRSDADGLIWFSLGDQDAGQGELAERAAAGTVAGPEADDALGLTLFRTPLTPV
jgi:hypothetical protein